MEMDYEALVAEPRGETRLFTIPLLSSHDHTAFEIFCYASVKRPDDLTGWAAPASAAAASANFTNWTYSSSPLNPTANSSTSPLRSATISRVSRRCAGNCGRGSSAPR